MKELEGIVAFYKQHRDNTQQYSHWYGETPLFVGAQPEQMDPVYIVPLEDLQFTLERPELPF